MRRTSMLLLAFLPIVAAAQAEDVLNRGTGDSASGSSFAFGLFHETAAQDKGGIVFVSPFSASVALSMTAAGADGTTREEILGTLGFDCTIEECNAYNRSVMEQLTSLRDGVEFNIANSLWVSDQFPVKKSYIRTVRRNYDAKAANLDFSDPATPSVINDWCSENTAGRIDKMIETIDPATRMYLLNALYFKGLWTIPFDASLTRQDTFHGTDGDSQVKFMHNKACFSYCSGREGAMIELSYGEGEEENLMMDVILPAEGVSIDEFASRFDEEMLAKFSASLYTDEIRLVLPSFKAEYETSLNAVLQRLGVREAFTSAADFSGMSGDPLMISEVKQKTFIEVNEEGSEAAAITSIGIMRTSLAPEPFEFKVDRPFVFLIRERNSGTILFMGLVRNL